MMKKIKKDAWEEISYQEMTISVSHRHKEWITCTFEHSWFAHFPRTTYRGPIFTARILQVHKSVKWQPIWNTQLQIGRGFFPIRWHLSLIDWKPSLFFLKICFSASFSSLLTWVLKLFGFFRDPVISQLIWRAVAYHKMGSYKKWIKLTICWMMKYKYEKFRNNMTESYRWMPFWYMPYHSHFPLVTILALSV